MFRLFAILIVAGLCVSIFSDKHHEARTWLNEQFVWMYP
jgi:hypothetical protein